MDNGQSLDLNLFNGRGAVVYIVLVCIGDVGLYAMHINNNLHNINKSEGLLRRWYLMNEPNRVKGLSEDRLRAGWEGVILKCRFFQIVFQSEKLDVLKSAFITYIYTTMRKITHKASQCLKNCQFFSCSNTLVSFEHGLRGMELHGNHIASYNKENNKLLIRDAGRQTNTKERLNGILTTFGITDGIYQKNWKWYIGNEERTGEKVFDLN